MTNPPKTLTLHGNRVVPDDPTNREESQRALTPVRWRWSYGTMILTPRRDPHLIAYFGGYVSVLV